MVGIGENILLALNGLKSNKMRALLTMLGIIIGISAVIGILCVGDAVTGSVTSSMSSLGVNNITAVVQQKMSTMDQSSMMTMVNPTDEDLITAEMLTALTEHVDGIENFSLSQSVGSGKAKDGHKYANLSVSGTNSGFMSANNVEMVVGRYLTEKDVQGRRYVAVLSDFAAERMFPNLELRDALGNELKVNVGEDVLNFTVVGIYKHVDSPYAMMGMTSKADTSTALYIPVSVAQRLKGTSEAYPSVTITAAESADAQKVTNEISDFLNRYYEDNTRFSVYVMSMESMVSQMTGMLSTISVAISVIAGISLLVGGIGVMNIMLVSVTERTREIGTRKALGAPNSAIRVQFVVEAMIICLIGGVIGVILGTLFGYIASNALGYPALPSVNAVLLAVSFSMAIGIFFGYYPANKAARLDPIEALRYE